ncbi:MAG: hypothetical protein ACHQ16_02630 [Candidatus Lutacidiplasmatales archaeon]
MKPFLAGAASGVVVGVSAIVLLQQFGILSLSDLVTGLVYLLATAIAAGIVFGIGGWLLSRSAMKRAQGILAKESVAGETSSPSSSTSASADPAADPGKTK